jgi:RNA polymerase sigma-70 factor (sigma-E family)
VSQQETTPGEEERMTAQPVPIDPLLAASLSTRSTGTTEPRRTDDRQPTSGHVHIDESRPRETDRYDDSTPVVSRSAATGPRVYEGIEGCYERLYPRLVRLAFLLVDTQEQAEEAVQDAFAKAYSKWDRILEPDAYMHTAVVNTCRAVQRRRALVRRTPHPRPTNARGADEVADHVADVVRRLPTQLRQVVVLRYYLQLSEPEIARTLGIALGTVKSSLHRARARLKEELS